MKKINKLIERIGKKAVVLAIAAVFIVGVFNPVFGSQVRNIVNDEYPEKSDEITIDVEESLGSSSCIVELGDADYGIFDMFMWTSLGVVSLVVNNPIVNGILELFTGIDASDDVNGIEYDSNELVDDQLNSEKQANALNQLLVQPMDNTDPMLLGRDGSWWNSSWSYRKEITISHSKVAGNLVNFPVLIDITDVDLRDDAQDSGDDIVFTDYSGNKLAHEIELFNGGSGELVCWVNVTSLSSTEDTILYMYYGNSSAVNQEDPAGVWDDGFVMVQHLEETSGTTVDSTIYGNNGTELISPDSNMDATGVIDGAIDFDGTDDYVSFGQPSSLDFTPNVNEFTISLWLKTTDTSAAIISKAYSSERQYYLYTTSASGLQAYIGGTKIVTSQSVDDGVWHYIVGVNYDDLGTLKFRFYIDGNADPTIIPSGSTTNEMDVLLAARRNNDNTDYSSNFDGIIDEVRISNNVRTSDWIDTEYNNQLNPSLFFSVGNEEIYGIPDEPILSDENPENNTVGIPIGTITLSVSVNDSQGEDMDVHFRTNASGTWSDIGANTTVPNGTYSQDYTFNDYGRIYWWSVNCSDGTHWTNATYKFITVIQEPVLSAPSPANGATGTRLNPTLSIYAYDHQGDEINVDFMTNASGSGWQQIGSTQTGYNNTYNQSTDMFNSFNTHYWWSVNVTDPLGSNNWTNKSFSFTTKNSPEFTQKWTVDTGGRNWRTTLTADIDGDGAKEIFFPSCPCCGPPEIMFVKVYSGANGSELWNYYDTNFTYNEGSSRIQVVDLNNDGIAEVLIPTTEYDKPGDQPRSAMVVLHGNNGSLYWNISGLDGGSHAGTPVVFDHDLDGYPTIFTASRLYGGTTSPAIYSLTYDGQINCKNNLITVVCAGGLSIMDYNNDGNFEVYAGDWTEGAGIPNPYGVVRAFYADNLTEIWHSSLDNYPGYKLGSAPLIPVLADATGDGIKEVITMIYENTTEHARVGYAVLSAEDGEILDVYILEGSAGGEEPAVYDIDDDGHNELIMVGFEQSPRSFTVLDLVDKNIDFQTGVNRGSWMHPTIADVTGDGNKEILVPDGSRILIYNKTYGLIEQLNLAAGGGHTHVVVDDVDGDGLVEIVVSELTHLQVFDTDAPIPAGGIRSGIDRFSEYRNGVAEYVTVLGLKDEIPQRNAVGVSLNPTLSVNATNYQHELMDITFRTNANGTWEDIINYNNVGNGIYTASPTNMDINGVTYWWSVNATDGYNTWTNMTYKLTTSTIYPILSNIYPGNDSVDIPLNPTLSVFVEDQQGDELNVSFMTNATADVWQQIGNTQIGYNNTYNQSTTMFDSFNTRYWWSLNCSDDMVHWTNETFCFTTKVNSPPNILDISPVDNAMMVPLSLLELGFNISDVDEQTMTYNLSTVPYIGSGSSSGVSDGQYSVPVSGLDYNTTYTWFVNVSDGALWTNESFSFTTCLPPAPWWNAAWLYRKEIIIDHEKVASNLTGFPVLINRLDTDLAMHAKDDGKDVLFTDYDGNKLNHEIELFSNSSGELVCWVNVTNLSSTEDTILYMYYGNPSADNQENPAGVWDEDFVMVQHMNETGTGTRFDSTVHGNDGNPGGYDGDEATTGIVDGADDFDGSDDYLDCGSDSSFNITDTNERTVEAWVKFYSINNWQRIFYCQLDSENGYQLVRSSANDFEFGVKEDGSLYEEQTVTKYTSTDTWFHIVSTVDAGHVVVLYVNGVPVADETGGVLFSSPTYGTWISSSSGITAFFDGVIDEVRVSNVARSSSWIATSFNTMNLSETFLSIGPEIEIEAEDSTLPEITNITGYPDSQETGGFVNITCDVTDNEDVDTVKVNITYPDSSYHNETMLEGSSYYYNHSYSAPGMYTYYIWANDTSDNSDTSSICSFSIVRWNAVLNISESGGKYNTAIFGEVDDASDGQDSYDVPKPPGTGEPYIRSWFDAGLSEPYDKLWSDYRDYPDDQEIWDLYMRCNTSGPALGDVDITISWDSDEINDSEYDKVELWNATGKVADMKTTGEYIFNASFDTNHHFQIKCRLEYIPGAPSGFTASASSTDQIDLSWIKGSNADKTYIEWNTTDDWIMGAGNMIYNDTGTGYAHIDLDPHTQYFYQAWGWNETDGTWSSSYAEDNDTTWNNPPGFGVPSPGNGSIDQDLSLTWSISITDLDGDTFDWSIDCSNGQSSGAAGDTDGIKQLSISGLSYDTTYTIWVNATDSYDSLSEWFTFKTKITPNVIIINQNWNIISLPFNESLDKSDIVVSYGGSNYSWNDAVTGGIVLDFIYGWNRTSQSYDTVDVLEPGYGYWMWSYHDDVNLLVSSNETGDGSITALLQQWNIVGLPYNVSLLKEDLIIHYNVTDYSWADAISSNNEEGTPLILGFIYGWDRYNQRYQISDDFHPSYGYWMYAYYSCTLKRGV